MATGNFMYTNRCVVVTDNDYENDNVPKRETSSLDTNRSHYRQKLYEYDLIFFEIVLTAGYYEGACIDYLEKETVDNWEYLGFMSEDEARIAYDLEVTECNATIDRLKLAYGYMEVATSATFSNGETMYQEV